MSFGSLDQGDPVTILVDGDPPSADYQTQVSAQAVDGGLDITVTVTNVSDSTSIKWPEFRVGIGLSSAMTHYWASDGPGKFRRIARGTPVIATFYGGVLLHNVMCLDDNAGNLVGVGCDYPYLTGWVWFTASPGTVSVIPGFTSPSQKRVMPDYIRPGETKTIRFWVRHKAAIDEANALDSLQPYVDWMQATYPWDPPPKLYGRLLYFNLAGPGSGVNTPGSDGRAYRSDIGDKHISQYRGFSELLDAIVARFGGVTNMRRHSYVGMMLWTLSGFGLESDWNFFPSCLSNLPPNLFNTLHEIPQWVTRNNFRIFPWMGRTHSGIQLGAWDTDVVSPLATGNYDTDDSRGNPVFDANNWAPWSLRPEAGDFWEVNTFRAPLFFTGAGFDADASACLDPWILNVHRELRRRAPHFWACTEAVHEDKSWQYFPTMYFQNTDVFGTEGSYQGRCPLMERIYPGHEAVVFLYHEGDVGARARFVEEQGHQIVSTTFLETPYAGETAPTNTGTRSRVTTSRRRPHRRL